VTRKNYYSPDNKGNILSGVAAGVAGTDAVNKAQLDAIAPAAPVSEVWIGPDAPTDPNTELWYDTDEPAPIALQGPQGEDGPPGPPGPPGSPSTDSGNAITTGTDGKLFTTPKILVLGPSDPVPGGTLAGTVIVRMR